MCNLYSYTRSQDEARRLMRVLHDRTGNQSPLPAIFPDTEPSYSGLEGFQRYQRQLAEASSVSLPTIKRLEARPGILNAHAATVMAIRHALEAAGIEFTNSERPGVRLRQGYKG